MGFLSSLFGGKKKRKRKTYIVRVKGGKKLTRAQAHKVAAASAAAAYVAESRRNRWF